MFTKEDYGHALLALAVIYLIYWRFAAYMPLEKLLNPSGG
jgi:hypothetical protein